MASTPRTRVSTSRRTRSRGETEPLLGIQCSPCMHESNHAFDSRTPLEQRPDQDGSAGGTFFHGRTACRSSQEWESIALLWRGRQSRMRQSLLSPERGFVFRRCGDGPLPVARSVLAVDDRDRDRGRTRVPIPSLAGPPLRRRLFTLDRRRARRRGLGGGLRSASTSCATVRRRAARRSGGSSLRAITSVSGRRSA
jgi:hypothetical protein